MSGNTTMTAASTKEFNPNGSMSTLVGVDGDSRYVAAVELLARLKFVNNRITLAHCEPTVELMVSPSPMVIEFLNSAEVAANMRAHGELLLADATRLTKERGLGHEIQTVYEIGNPSVTLLRRSEETHCDLVAVGSYQHGPVESFFLGSVGRAMAISARHSFLIARNVAPRTGKVHVVFATDQSEYADRCLSRLLDMAPEGIGRLTLVTAVDPRLIGKAADELGMESSTPYVRTEAEHRLQAHGAELAAKWQARGVEAEFELIEGYPTDVLRAVMTKTGADLLALGARGHGLIERILIGSLALHEVVAESFPVLVLRIPEEA